MHRRRVIPYEAGGDCAGARRTIQAERGDWGWTQVQADHPDIAAVE